VTARARFRQIFRCNAGLSRLLLLWRGNLTQNFVWFRRTRILDDAHRGVRVITVFSRRLSERGRYAERQHCGHDQASRGHFDLVPWQKIFRPEDAPTIADAMSSTSESRVGGWKLWAVVSENEGSFGLWNQSAHDRHIGARGFGRSNSRGRVFEYQALLDSYAKPLRTKQESLRVGFAALDVFGGDHHGRDGQIHSP